MRPRKAKQILNNICKNFYKLNFDDPDVLKEYKHGIKLLIKNERVVDQLLEIIQKESYDFWVGHFDEPYIEPDSYYQIGDIDGIYSTLFYISDKWNCVGRLKYIKELIKYFKERNCENY